MFKIVDKKYLSDNVIRFDIEAPDTAASRKPGQFVLVIPTENSERAPFTIMDSDTVRGTISIIVQVVGTATHKLASLNTGDKVYAVAGPLGHPTEIKNFGTVVCIGGGVGTAVMYPITKALKKAGCKIFSIIGGRSKNLLILEKEMAEVSDKAFVTTDDGSKGLKGLVTFPLKNLLDSTVKINMVFAIGPAIMMKSVASLTAGYNIKTIVSLNSIMIDGTGMCGSCRVNVDGKPKFVCVDGPEFDGQLIDWDNLMSRQSAFKHKEKCSLDKYLEGIKK